MAKLIEIEDVQISDALKAIDAQNKINKENIPWIRDVIFKNKKHSRQIRKEIRKYGIDTFGLENILAYEYIPKLQSLL